MRFIQKKNLLVNFLKKLLTLPHVNIPFNYPDRWQLQKEVPSVSPQVKVKVLVISYLFPHPEQPGLGSFVLEQIKGLQGSEQNIEVRVLSGRPHYIGFDGIRNPLRTLKNPRTTFYKLCYDLHHTVRMLYNFLVYHHVSDKHWWSIENVSVKYVPYPILGKFWTHGWSYQKLLAKSAKK